MGVSAFIVRQGLACPGLLPFLGRRPFWPRALPLVPFARLGGSLDALPLGVPSPVARRSFTP